MTLSVNPHVPPQKSQETQQKPETATSPAADSAQGVKSAGRVDDKRFEDNVSLSTSPDGANGATTKAALNKEKLDVASADLLLNNTLKAILGNSKASLAAQASQQPLNAANLLNND